MTRRSLVMAFREGGEKPRIDAAIRLSAWLVPSLSASRIVATFGKLHGASGNRVKILSDDVEVSVCSPAFRSDLRSAAMSRPDRRGRSATRPARGTRSEIIQCRTCGMERMQRSRMRWWERAFGPFTRKRPYRCRRCRARGWYYPPAGQSSAPRDGTNAGSPSEPSPDLASLDN